MRSSRPISWRGSARSGSAGRAARPPRSRPPTTGSPASKPRSRETSTKVHLVGCKGGVGKTTCAAALAIDCARRGHRTLVLSADPAPSLGDAFAVPLAAAPRRIPLRSGSLHALEIDARRALERWLRPRRSAFETIALRGTWLDTADVRQLLRLSLPGIDEIAALLELLRFRRSGRYDVIVVDTAPTGHTLRMLAMPRTLAMVARVFDTMEDKHRALVQALGRAVGRDEADRLIEELREDSRALSALLRDRAVTEVTVVCLPEALAVEETLDTARHLLDAEFPLARVVMNRVTAPPPRHCRWCRSRRTWEGKALARLAQRLRVLARERRAEEPAIGAVPAREREPVGLRALRDLANDLAGTTRPARIPPATASLGTPPRVASVAPSTGRVELPPARLLMFGGKGGVGKTTCAAAWALQLAIDQPERRFLLVSTDPAHSLGDVVGAALSNAPGRAPGCPRNLLLRELDARRALDAVSARYAASVDALFDRLSRGSSFDLRHDRAVMHELLELAPAGLDELAAVLELLDLLNEDGEDKGIGTVILDTAPTGHALRLLEMPAIVRDWTRALMSIVLKYQPVIGIGGIGEALLRLSRGLGRLIALLSSADAQFVVVTRAAMLPRAETTRLVRRLRRLRIAVGAVIVNEAGAGSCSRCRAKARRERREIEALAAAVPHGRLFVAPAVVPPPVGAPALQAWGCHWRRGLGRGAGGAPDGCDIISICPVGGGHVCRAGSDEHHNLRVLRGAPRPGAGSAQHAPGRPGRIAAGPSRGVAAILDRCVRSAPGHLRAPGHRTPSPGSGLGLDDRARPRSDRRAHDARARRHRHPDEAVHDVLGAGAGDCGDTIQTPAARPDRQANRRLRRMGSAGHARHARDGGARAGEPCPYRRGISRGAEAGPRRRAATGGANADRGR